MRIALGAMAMAAVLAAGCNDSTGSSGPPHVDMEDACDSATFNAALGAGTCTKRGGETFAQFNAELNANHTVAAWRFVPATLTVHARDSIIAVNQGGEVHTFTEVEQFGGGIVAALNTASGNTTVAPECQALESDDFVHPGSRYGDVADSTAGTERYQCCIHPWMRTLVTVRQ